VPRGTKDQIWLDGKLIADDSFTGKRASSRGHSPEKGHHYALRVDSAVR
jgi:hypothetical protein